MGLSKERQDIFERVLKTKLREVKGEQTNELLAMRTSLKRRGPWLPALYRKHAEQMRELGEFIIAAYKDAVRKEGRRLNRDDVSAIYWTLTATFNDVAADRDRKIDEFVGSSDAAKVLVQDVIDGFRDQLELEVDEAILEEEERQRVMGRQEARGNRDPRKVFVVHGRNEKARRAMFDFLRALNLHPQEWNEWVHETGQGSPYVGEVLKRGFEVAQAFVVLLTPDDEARLREPLRGDNDDPHEINPTGQPRQNVTYEAGMAMGIDETRTILVELGRLRPISDVFGRHVVRINNTPERRKELAQRLIAANCAVNTLGNDWLTAGDFDAALEDL